LELEVVVAANFKKILRKNQFSLKKTLSTLGIQEEI
jgi:hypothetical protein